MKILIIGLGRLGKKLLNDKDDFYSLSRSIQKIESKQGLNQFEYFLGQDLPKALPQDFDIAIFSLPPHKGIIETIQILDCHLQATTKLVFISSTSVYSMGQITEKSPRDGSGFRHENLVQVEDAIHQTKRENVIIRPSGIWDEEKSILKFIAKKEKIQSANKMINLVHLDDVANFIRFAIEKKVFNDDFNLCIDDHPVKKDFYTKLIIKESLPMPEWIECTESENKLIDNSKSKRIGFSYKYKNSNELI